MDSRWPGELVEHEEIVAWAQAHPEVLSANLAMISAYPIAFRKVIVNLMSAPRRLALWREHLEAAASDPELSGAQKAVILETAAGLSDIFSSPSAKREWQQRAGKLFSAAQQHALFGTLGPPEPPGGLPLPHDARPTAPA